MSRLVDQLERRGWTERVVSDTDARVQLIDLTTAGRTVAAGITARRRARLGGVLDRIPVSERDAVLAASTTLVEATRDLDPTRDPPAAGGGAHHAADRRPAPAAADDPVTAANR